MFNKASVNFERLIDTVDLRIAMWSKAKWPELNEEMTEIICDPSSISILGSGKVVRENIQWFSPLYGILDSNTSELIEVKEAFKLFINSRWGNSHTLVVENDSANMVVVW
ncbi:hypothetical protein PTKIN_Ptkin14bG0133300 [Pterospermum kingtungense]